MKKTIAPEQEMVQGYLFPEEEKKDLKLLEKSKEETARALAVTSKQKEPKKYVPSKFGQGGDYVNPEGDVKRRTTSKKLDQNKKKKGENLRKTEDGRKPTGGFDH